MGHHIFLANIKVVSIKLLMEEYVEGMEQRERIVAKKDVPIKQAREEFVEGMV